MAGWSFQSAISFHLLALSASKFSAEEMAPELSVEGNISKEY